MALIAISACAPDDAVPIDRPTWDAQPIDSAIPDALVSDAQVSDAQVSDAQVSDAQVSDAQVSDAQVSDAQFEDALLDATRVLDMRLADMPDMAPDVAPPDMAPDMLIADMMLPDFAPPDMAPDMPVVDMMLGPGRLPEPGDLVITEVLAEPEAVRESLGEWFEVHNQSDAVLDLTGLVLTNARIGQLAERAVVVGLRPVAPGAFGVIGREADIALNGGVRLHAFFDGMTLNNSSDAIVISTPDGVELDRVAWDNGQTFPDVPGASMQLDLDEGYAVDNADGALWCASRTPFGTGDLGTPGTANIACRGAFTAAEFQSLVITRCPGCHTAGGRLGGLNLDDHTLSIGRPALQIAALTLIEPGDRARSYLYIKLTDRQASVGGDGTVMPQEGALDPDTIERVGRYIDGLPR